MLKKRSAILAAGFVVTMALTMPATAHANTITYSNSLTFQAALGASVTDSYSDPGYQNGNKVNGAGFDIFFNAAMSAVLGETDYQTTGHTDQNILENGSDGDYDYCAGCNGSFRLTFTTTTVGTASGVYGAGFNFANTDPTVPYHAFVTFGDGSTADYLLAVTPLFNFTNFFGITSDLLISSIHLGLANGGTTTGGAFAIDDLTIGAASVPDATSTLGLFMGVALLGFVAQRLWT